MTPSIKKMESVQYNFALNMTGSIRGTSVEKIYQELGLESLPKRRWYRKLSHFFRLFKGQFREYLFKILTSVSKGYITRTNNNIPHFSAKCNTYRNSSFSSTVIEWNNLDLKIRNSDTFCALEKSIFKFIRPCSNFIICCHSPKGIKLITRLTLGLSYLHEHKFRHNFQDTLYPICSCGDGIETTIHNLLHCPNYLDERRTLLGNLQNIEEKIHDKSDLEISELPLFGVSSTNDASNTCIHITQIHVT